MPKKADNVIKLYRELMAGITLEDVRLPVITDGDKYREFCRYCNEVYTNEFFNLIKQQILLAQVSTTVIDSNSYEQLQFGRAVVNGLALVEELFKKYSNEFEEKFMNNEGGNFDPSKSFDPVNY